MKFLGPLKKDMIILLGLSIVVILVCFAMFVLMPAMKKFRSFAAQERQLREQIGQASQVVANREQVTAEIDRLKNTIALYEAMLPRQIETSDIIEYLIAKGKQYNVAFVALEPQERKITTLTQQKKDYIELPFKLKLKAGYHDFARFVNSIETAERFMEVQDFTVQAGTGGEKNHDISLSVIAFAVEEGK